MDPSGFRPSPRQEIQLKGSRPSALSLGVSKDSHSIRKQAAPAATAAAPSRDPVIIYSVSPKIIHAEPGEFMTLVQRLTGPDSAAPPSPGPGALSPAARIASFERSSPRASALVDLEPDCRQALGRQGGAFPGILSPEPEALSPILPNLFSPSSFDLSFSPQWSPAFADKNFFTSPSNNFFSTPTVPSPGSFWELLHQFPDLIEK